MNKCVKTTLCLIALGLLGISIQQWAAGRREASRLAVAPQPAMAVSVRPAAPTPFDAWGDDAAEIVAFAEDTPTNDELAAGLPVDAKAAFPTTNPTAQDIFGGMPDPITLDAAPPSDDNGAVPSVTGDTPPTGVPSDGTATTGGGGGILVGGGYGTPLFVAANITGAGGPNPDFYLSGDLGGGGGGGSGGGSGGSNSSVHPSIIRPALDPSNAAAVPLPAAILLAPLGAVVAAFSARRLRKGAQA